MEKIDIKNALLETSLCQFLKPDELNIVVEHCDIVLFEAGEFILYQGKRSEGLYIIIEGEASVSAKVLGEGVMDLATLNIGNILGEISVLENGPCATSVISTRSTKCLFIKSKFFEMMSFFLPNIKYQLSLAISYEVVDRLKKIHKKITHIMAETKMAEISLFGVVIQSITNSSITSFEEQKMDKNILKNLEFFKSFNEEEFNQLLDHAELIAAPNNCVLIQEDDEESACYIVLQGAVQLSIVQDNKFAKLFVLDPISLFFSLSLIDSNSPSVINYTSCERVILLKISAHALEHLQKNNLKLWYKMFNFICKSLVVLEKSADKLDIRLHSELYNR
ncbi:MAG: cyclic nucleotide-binding domain-containing protein [Gammaproteobacteria bacterium]